jgi:hypothetical protein
MFGRTGRHTILMQPWWFQKQGGMRGLRAGANLTGTPLSLGGEILHDSPDKIYCKRRVKTGYCQNNY